MTDKHNIRQELLSFRSRHNWLPGRIDIIVDQPWAFGQFLVEQVAITVARMKTDIAKIEHLRLNRDERRVLENEKEFVKQFNTETKP